MHPPPAAQPPISVPTRPPDGLTLVTRDVGRYQTYFPSVKLVAPDGHT